MPVSGQELASLDFANLIGGPLNAVVESQAKAALTTVNFIKEVAFDDKNMVRTVKFGYTRKNDNDKPEEFELTVPFLTMLPIPYITVTNATIEFNAKITSVNAKEMNDDFQTEVTAGANAGGSAGLGTRWYASAYLQTKTSYQRKSASSDKEERTFDMHVKVEARNQDMPAGTERLLTILENSISESKKPSPGGGAPAVAPKVSAKIKDFDDATNTITIENCSVKINKGATFKDDQDYTVASVLKGNGSDEWVLTVNCSSKMAPTKGATIDIDNP